MISFIHIVNTDFRTPRSHVQTPTKSYKELLSFSRFNRNVKSAVGLEKPAAAGMEEKRMRKLLEEGCCNLEEKWKLRSNGVVEKQKKKNFSSEKDRVWVEKLVVADEHEHEIDEHEEDDGGETDSSSDLFELQIYDLDYYSNGLPVYESTNIDTIKRRNSVSSGVC